MKQVIIEKTIELDHVYERIDDLSCRKNVITTALSEGLQCTGTIDITGNGVIGSHQIPVNESIDLSIFAPFNKISETEQFDVQLKDYELLLEDNQLKCKFTFEVFGVHDGLENDDARLEDLLDDSSTVFTKLRYIITSGSDTYFTIADRYNVDEKKLRELNHDKILSGRTLILLPFS